MLKLTVCSFQGCNLNNVLAFVKTIHTEKGKFVGEAEEVMCTSV